MLNKKILCITNKVNFVISLGATSLNLFLSISFHISLSIPLSLFIALKSG